MPDSDSKASDRQPLGIHMNLWESRYFLTWQDMASWTRDGIAGLQSVVLYSLPELDGAIDTVPLGGLVNNDIHLVPERVQRLAARLKKWVSLRRTAEKVGIQAIRRPNAYCPMHAAFFLRVVN